MLTKGEIVQARQPYCDTCALHKQCTNPYMSGRGNQENPVIAIVGDFPGTYEDKAGFVFGGRYGEFVTDCLRDVGITANRDTYMTLAVRCKPMDNKPKDAHVKLCAHYLFDDLIRVKPKVILAIGSVAFFALTGMKKLKENRGLPKLVTLTSLTGGGETHEAIVVPTWSPGYIINNASALPHFLNDVAKVIDIARNGGKLPEPPKVNYRVVCDEQSEADFKEEMRKSKRYAWDTETTGVNSFAKDAKIVCVTFTFKPHSGWLIPLHTIEREHPQTVNIKLSLERCIELVKWALGLKRYVIGQNLKFDELFVRNTLGFTPRSASFDTMIANHLLDEESMMNGSASLKSMAELYTDMGGYEQPFLERFPNAYKEMIKLPIKGEGKASLLYYACADTDVAMQVCDALTKKLEEEGLMPTLALEMQKHKLLVDMEHRGARIDFEYNAKALIDFEVEIDKSLKRLQSFPEVRKLEKLVYGKENQGSLFGPERFNPNSPKQMEKLCLEVLDLPRLEGKTKAATGSHSCDAEAIQAWLDGLHESSSGYQILSSIKEYKGMCKLLSTYISKMADWADADGRIHTHFNSAVARTWRLSSSNPNMMNLPRNDDSRGAIGKGVVKRHYIGGKPGWWVAEADYSQVELRVLALVSQDENMLRAYFNGDDIHTYVASQMFHCDMHDVSKQQRTAAKTIVFGIVYGFSEMGLAKKLSISEYEAAKFIGMFYSGFPGISVWIEEQRKFILDHGYSVSLFGHKRRLPNAFSKNEAVRERALRQGVNFVIQCTASNMALYSEMYLNRYLMKFGYASYCFGQVHDSIWVTGPDSEKDEVLRLVVKVMENPPFDFLSGDDPRFPDVPPIVADIAVGYNLAELEAVDWDAE